MAADWRTHVGGRIVDSRTVRKSELRSDYDDYVLRPGVIRRLFAAQRDVVVEFAEQVNV